VWCIRIVIGMEHTDFIQWMTSETIKSAKPCEWSGPIMRRLTVLKDNVGNNSTTIIL